TRLQHVAGMRTEPPVSDPRLANTRPAATAAAGPLEDPPVMYWVFQGLRGVPVNSLWPVGPYANSTMLSRATSRAPAASSRWSTVAVWSGVKFARMREPQA